MAAMSTNQAGGNGFSSRENGSFRDPAGGAGVRRRHSSSPGGQRLSFGISGLLGLYVVSWAVCDVCHRADSSANDILSAFIGLKKSGAHRLEWTVSRRSSKKR